MRALRLVCTVVNFIHSNPLIPLSQLGFQCCASLSSVFLFFFSVFFFVTIKSINLNE